ncbi:hypothetical protein BGX31_005985, partial [Mortierella sp. GBA43]
YAKAAVISGLRRALVIQIAHGTATYMRVNKEQGFLALEKVGTFVISITKSTMAAFLADLDTFLQVMHDLEQFASEGVNFALGSQYNTDIRFEKQKFKVLHG